MMQNNTDGAVQTVEILKEKYRLGMGKINDTLMEVQYSITSMERTIDDLQMIGANINDALPKHAENILDLRRIMLAAMSLESRNK